MSTPTSALAVAASAVMAATTRPRQQQKPHKVHECPRCQYSTKHINKLWKHIQLATCIPSKFTSGTRYMTTESMCAHFKAEKVDQGHAWWCARCAKYFGSYASLHNHGCYSDASSNNTSENISTASQAQGAPAVPATAVVPESSSHPCAAKGLVGQV